MRLVKVVFFLWLIILKLNYLQMTFPVSFYRSTPRLKQKQLQRITKASNNIQCIKRLRHKVRCFYTEENLL